MRETPDRAEALVVLAFRFGNFAGGNMRPRHAVLAVLILAIKPQRRMRPEECKYAYDQHKHELRNDPHDRIALVIVRVRMRLEGDEPPRRIGVTLLARLQPMVRMHG